MITRKSFYSSSFAFLLFLLLVTPFASGQVIVPRPSQVFVTLIQKWPALWPHTVQTLYTTMLGFVLGVAIGVVIGVIIGGLNVRYLFGSIL